MSTGLYWDEACLWHAGSGYVLTAPVGPWVQPVAAGGLAEDPETKRRLLNLLRKSGLYDELSARTAPPAARADLLRVHPAGYLDTFKAMSDAGGGEITPGARAPFGPQGYEIAALSAGLVMAALDDVLTGKVANAYALSRPPGHHCLPDRPNGFCLLANIAIAVEAARAAGRVTRVAVVDWDVHHGNGTEAIFYNDPNVLTISIHQDRNYPWDTGGADDIGAGAGLGANLNIPLPPGGGHRTYLAAVDRLVLPKLQQFQPDVVIVACGFDASGVDPLSRMIASADTFARMTEKLMRFCADTCDGKLVMAHEGGYSELHVPFCGHAVLATLAGSDITVPDALGPRMDAQQPAADVVEFFDGIINSYADRHDLK